MVFSIGQNFFKDLLKSSDKVTHNDQTATEQTYLKQKRLNDYWVNNDLPVLLKSKKYGGITDLLGESEPLGGHINLHMRGARNAPGIHDNGCPSEYPFWKTPMHKTPMHKTPIQVTPKNIKNENITTDHVEKFKNITPDNIEHFQSSPKNNVEKFENTTTTNYCFLPILIIMLLFLIIMVYFYIKSINK